MTPEEKAEAMQPALKPLLTEAQAVMDGKEGRLRKYIKLVAVANAVNKVIAPHAPCKRGCDACCHISVGITFHEAQVLAMASGRKQASILRSLEETSAALHKAQDDFYGVPCPFLKDHECSVYHARPMACRTHHVLNETAAQCATVPGETRKPIIATLGIASELQGAASSMFFDLPVGDIREFFSGGGDGA